MQCPRCEQGTLDEREREGITVDVCRSCRGVWLDRGELEKLIARATRELEDPAYGRGDPGRPPMTPGYPPQPPYAQGAQPPYAQGAPSPYAQGAPPPYAQGAPSPYAQGAPSPYAQGAPPPYGAPPHRYDDTPPRGTPRYGDGQHGGHHYDPRKRKKHWLESLGDIFD